MKLHKIIMLSGLSLCVMSAKAEIKVRVSEVGPGYSKTSVNTAVFRKNSLVTVDSIQYIAYYNPDGYLTIGKRNIRSDSWTIQPSKLKGRVKDAHNVISIGVDGEGYLHVAYDHHGNPLNYVKSIAPGSIELGEPQAMTGLGEGNVTYPEFYTLKSGDLLFVFRSGESGRGDMVINRYDVKNRQWYRVKDKLIDGEDVRSPYWQIFVDGNDVIHVSWVWRESWLVETNHDLCYAKSKDGGQTWMKSDGNVYTLPITASNAEYAWRICQNSELINQTSMTADQNSNPYIATYWREEGDSIPQYHIVWHDGDCWYERAISKRVTPFSLSGGGTKMIPISRPQIFADRGFIGVLYRDIERQSRVSMLTTNFGPDGEWTVTDLTEFSVGAWEPTFDIDRWKDGQGLSVFVQDTSQGDGERTVETLPTPVMTLDVTSD